ncbi:MAG: carboxypeptidase-like regulatory domain-containing protein [Myxococcales bacterium]|jgi:hypothetical protein|nr:carboxypeptidase-like regulatory domain-containing protein [Myxococcales bacterium]
MDTPTKSAPTRIQGTALFFLALAAVAALCWSLWFFFGERGGEAGGAPEAGSLWRSTAKRAVRHPLATGAANSTLIGRVLSSDGTPVEAEVLLFSEDALELWQARCPHANHPPLVRCECDRAVASIAEWLLDLDLSPDAPSATADWLAPIARATSDSEGFFELTVPAAGPLALAVRSRSLPDASSRSRVEEAAFLRAPTFDELEGMADGFVTIRLLPAEFAATGHVFDPEGRRIDGARVTAIPLFFPLPRVVQVDREGKFDFDALSALTDVMAERVS